MLIPAGYLHAIHHVYRACSITKRVITIYIANCMSKVKNKSSHVAVVVYAVHNVHLSQNAYRG